jgi:hypothetical protein
MAASKECKGYRFQVYQVYRFWGDVLVTAATPEEAYRQAVEQLQLDWSHSELLECTATLTGEEEPRLLN